MVESMDSLSRTDQKTYLESGHEVGQAIRQLDCCEFGGATIR